MAKDKPELNIKVAQYGRVLFEDQPLACALASNGMIYVPVVDICNILGIDPDAQVERIRAHHALQQGLVKIDFQVKYGETAFQTRSLNAISITRLHTWLIMLEVSRVENQAIRPKLAAMQEELADLVYGYFGRPLLPPDMREELETALPEEKSVLYEGLENVRNRVVDTEWRVAETEGKVGQLEERLKQLEILISPAVTEFITPQQRNQYRTIVAILGDLLSKKGKGDTGHVESDLKRMFNFTSYKVIPAEDWDRILQYCIQWYRRLTPPGTPLPEVFARPQQKRLL